MSTSFWLIECRYRFSPTVFGIELFACMTVWSLECAMLKFLFYLYSVSPGFFEVFAFVGYKFVGLALSGLLRLLTNNFIANCALGYFSLMMSVFLVFCWIFVINFVSIVQNIAEIHTSEHNAAVREKCRISDDDFGRCMWILGIPYNVVLSAILTADRSKIIFMWLLLLFIVCIDRCNAACQYWYKFRYRIKLKSTVTMINGRENEAQKNVAAYKIVVAPAKNRSSTQWAVNHFRTSRESDNGLSVIHREMSWKQKQSISLRIDDVLLTS